MKYCDLKLNIGSCCGSVVRCHELPTFGSGRSSYSLCQENRKSGKKEGHVVKTPLFFYLIEYAVESAQIQNV